MRTFIAISCVIVLSACVPNNRYEYRPVSGLNSGFTAYQANLMCKSRANRARHRARRQFTQEREANRPIHENTTCTGYGYAINCRTTSRRVRGGFVAALADGLSKGLQGNTAYDNEMKSCMADKGFGKFRVSKRQR
jgi:hypothetical protein